MPATPSPCWPSRPALADLGRYGEAEKVIQAIDGETLRGIPAQAVLSILAARLWLARGDLAQAATAAARPWPPPGRRTATRRWATPVLA